MGTLLKTLTKRSKQRMKTRAKHYKRQFKKGRTHLAYAILPIITLIRYLPEILSSTGSS